MRNEPIRFPMRGVLRPMLLAVGLLGLSACWNRITDPPSFIDLAPFKALAQTADCTDTRNRLFLIDYRLVFWDRAGNCADARYGYTLYSGVVDSILCENHDSIGGPIIRYIDPGYRGMFDTIVENLHRPDLGIGADHLVRRIPF